MKMIKEKLNELLTGIKNRFGLNGSLPGNYQMAVLRLK
jgi:hypothetical protein